MGQITGINLTSLSVDSSNNDQGAQTTTSISVPAGSIIMAMTAVALHSGTPSIPSLSGLGLTWNQITTIVSHVNLRSTLFYALVPNSVNGTVTITPAENEADIYLVLDQLTFIKLDSSVIVQNNTAVISNTTGTSLSDTLSAFANADNVAYAGIYIDNDDTLTPGSGMSVLKNKNAAHTVATAYGKNVTSPSFSWTPPSHAAMIAAEIVFEDRAQDNAAYFL